MADMKPDLDPLQVARVHETALEVLDLCVSPLQQALELQVRLGSVQKHNHLLNLQNNFWIMPFYLFIVQ